MALVRWEEAWPSKVGGHPGVYAPPTTLVYTTLYIPGYTLHIPYPAMLHRRHQCYGGRSGESPGLKKGRRAWVRPP